MWEWECGSLRYSSETLLKRDIEKSLEDHINEWGDQSTVFGPEGKEYEIRVSVHLVEVKD